MRNTTYEIKNIRENFEPIYRVLVRVDWRPNWRCTIKEHRTVLLKAEIVQEYYDKEVYEKWKNEFRTAAIALYPDCKEFV